MFEPHPPIDVLINVVGPWTTVRVQQPFEALRGLGWDVRFHQPPLDLNKAVRPNSLVIWQRPVPVSWAAWLEIVQLVRRRGSLLLVEWDDHPALFPAEVQERMQACEHAQLRIAHALHCSCPALARALEPWHPHTLVVENGVEATPPLNLNKHHGGGPLRVFLGNLNRVEEHRQLVPGLRSWLMEDEAVQLVCAGPTGIAGALPEERVQQHALLNYTDYRKLLASCQLALLPLQRGEPQACKTPIKWLEAAAESCVVIAGPELYGPWLAEDQYGMWANAIKEVVPLARALARDPVLRQRLASEAHRQSRHHDLGQLIRWRGELYRHVWRLSSCLDRHLVQRWPCLTL